MATARRSVRSIKTMAGLVDRRRARTTSGALLEMSVLAGEKERLQQELSAARRRRAEIENRLAEIAEKEGRLRALVKDPVPVRAADAPGTEARRIKVKEIRY